MENIEKLIFEPMRNLEIDKDVFAYFYDYFKYELDNLYYPDLYILPLTVDGEVILENLRTYYYIDRYGSYCYTKKYKGEYYNIILVNND